MNTHQPLKEKTIIGFQWNVMGQVVMYAVQLIGSVVLSRILGPSEFGLFAMLAILSSLASLVVSLGLAQAIVQNQSLNQRDLSSIFWLNLLLGSCVGLAFYFSSELIAGFYNQPELGEISRNFSLIFLIYGCSSVPIGLLSKRLDFKHLILSQLIAAICSYTISILLAYSGWGVWSLLVQAMTNHFLFIVLNFYFARWLPSLYFSMESLSTISKFIRNFLPSQLLDFLALNLDMLLIGKSLGKTDLGYYGRASALVQLPVNSIGQIFNKTFFPVFAALQEKPETLSINYIKSLKYLSLSLMPILILTAVAADQIILFLFGQAWVAMAPLTSLLSIVVAIGAYNSFNDSVITSQGRTDLLLRINFVEKLILILSIAIGFKYGLIGIVYAKMIAVLLTFIPKLLVLTHVIKISIKDWFFQQRLIFAGILICGVTGYLLHDLVSILFVSLVLVASGGLLSLFLFLLLTREQSLFEAITFLKNSLLKK